ncbi:MAG: DUF4031 domain-containing protein [Chloroflexi bacterium]|nr:DUF4031 domain-containing protein [Chloroflexota bacterium]
MSVYVDTLVSCLPNRNWRWTKTCHLFADTEAELLAFAARMNLKPEWFQSNRSLPHYDLAPSKRRRAVCLGALEVDRRFVCSKILAALAAKEARK